MGSKVMEQTSEGDNFLHFSLTFASIYLHLIISVVWILLQRYRLNASTCFFLPLLTFQLENGYTQ